MDPGPYNTCVSHPSLPCPPNCRTRYADRDITISDLSGQPTGTSVPALDDRRGELSRQQNARAQKEYRKRKKEYDMLLEARALEEEVNRQREFITRLVIEKSLRRGRYTGSGVFPIQDSRLKWLNSHLMGIPSTGEQLNDSYQIPNHWKYFDYDPPSSPAMRLPSRFEGQYPSYLDLKANWVQELYELTSSTSPNIYLPSENMNQTNLDSTNVPPGYYDDHLIPSLDASSMLPNILGTEGTPPGDSLGVPYQGDVPPISFEDHGPSLFSSSTNTIPPLLDLGPSHQREPFQDFLDPLTIWKEDPTLPPPLTMDIPHQTNDPIPPRSLTQGGRKPSVFKVSRERCKGEPNLLRLSFTNHPPNHSVDELRRGILDRLIERGYQNCSILEPNHLSVEGMYILGPAGFLFERFSIPMSILYALIDEDLHKCLCCGETKRTTPRAIGCVRAHLNLRPFACPGRIGGCLSCVDGQEPASFFTKALRNDHIDGQIKKLTCIQCGTSLRRGGLKRHWQIKHKEVPFPPTLPGTQDTPVEFGALAL